MIAELDEARDSGVTIAEILAASKGMLAENDLMSIIERKRVSLAAYGALHVALSHLPGAPE